MQVTCVTILVALAVVYVVIYYSQSKKPLYQAGDVVEYQGVKFYIHFIESDTGNVHIRRYSDVKYYPILIEKRVHFTEIKPIIL